MSESGVTWARAAEPVELRAYCSELTDAPSSNRAYRVWFELPNKQLYGMLIPLDPEGRIK